MKDIIESAQKKGICQEFLEEMKKAKSIKPFVRMFFDHDDWSGEHDFPGLEIARKYRAKAINYGIFVDIEEGIDFLNVGEIALLGKSKGKILSFGHDVTKVIVRHDSEIQIKAIGNSIVYVNLIDNAKVDAIAEDNAQIFIYNYGPNTHYKLTGRATEVKKIWGE